VTTKSPEELRGEAAQDRQDALDSFERSDTDGFVSQWASSMTAQLKEVQARIAEYDGYARFRRVRLETVDGRATDARLVKTRYGKKWRLDSTDEWITPFPARERTMLRKGYREVYDYALAPAKAFLDAPSGARGLGGATSVYVRVMRSDLDGPEAFDWVLDSFGSGEAL
jgi:hypothetical protein